METEDLVEEIRLAFASVPRPSMTLDSLLHDSEPRDDLWVTRLVDCCAPTWEDISPELMEAEMHGLTALSPLAFKFFLPAYMSYTVRNFEDAGVTDNVIYALDLSKGATIRDIQLSRFHVLTDSQSKATLHYLEFFSDPAKCGDDVVAREAIANYWGKFGAA